MRRVCAGTARVSGGASPAGTLGRASLSCGGTLTAPAYLSSSPFFIRTPHRCASSVAGGGGGRDDVSFFQKLKNLYREFQLSQDRKLDAVAAEEAQEGLNSFFEDEHRDDPRHPSSSSSRGSSDDGSTHPRDSPLISCNPNLCPRSVLFVPGSKPRAMEKIPSLSADCFILDLEDSVGVGSKRQARENIRSFVEGLQKTRRMHRDAQVSGMVNAFLQKHTKKVEGSANADEAGASSRAASGRVHHKVELFPRLIIRINSPDFDPTTAMLDLELVGLLGPAIEGVAIPKTTPRSYALVKNYVHPSHQLWAFFEAPKSVIQAPIICKQQVYQYAVMGYNDLSLEMQLPMASAPHLSDNGLSEAVRESLHIAAQLPLWQCTAQVLQAARAYNMFVLDAVFNDPTDTAGFRRSLLECKALGLNGKTLIHPSQIEPTNAIYTPSEAEVTWATRIIEAVRKARGGVATVDGKMVEELHKRQADRLLALHHSIEAEKQQRAREAAEKARAGETPGAGEKDDAEDAREPRQTPSRHRPLR
ncbi:putative mitochondrial hypothetical protein [Leptomonas pyrrhocoris]|uniref:HpcH/HpaI aldolase/citrate lyase domain-containing protein n=1 Tax=Leptomonas pyrrhocoris TaxID=157538 RepID=A0A0M9FZB3_LEPPY|nr:putative mitochondrial hypothetical protein [Leptomonas pyrrhocoris]KPA79220.1 putative mitochondrial hypothetical protein [Leptomonas pyrrhocoris]|eukprot:XP_015657659.1 putative mitochondrial hypothetical protein [Leptomonas pyrrhocoris]